MRPSIGCALALIGLYISPAATGVAAAQTLSRDQARRPTLAQCTDQWHQQTSARTSQGTGTYQEFMRNCFDSAAPPGEQSSAEPDQLPHGTPARLQKVKVICSDVDTGTLLIKAQLTDRSLPLFASPARVQSMLNFLRSYGQSYCDQELRAGHQPSIAKDVSLRVAVVQTSGQVSTELRVWTARAVGEGSWQIANDTRLQVIPQEEP